MRKLILALLVLTVAMSGWAYAAELTQLQTAQLAALGKGRSVVSDGSVILKVWYTGSDNGAVGVSNNSTLMLYSEYIDGTATTIDTSSSSYDTVGEVVDYINNSVDDFSANVGPDGYRALGTTTLLPKSIDTSVRLKTKFEVNDDCSTAGYLTCGVEASSPVTPRIRQFTDKFYITSNGYITKEIYEGDTRVYMNVVSRTNYISTGTTASDTTVTFTANGDTGGLSGTKNVPLVVKVTPSVNNLADCSGTTEKSAAVNISILYDEFTGL